MKVLKRLAWTALGLAVAASAGCPNDPVGDDAFMASGIDAFSEELDARASELDSASPDDAYAEPDAFVEVDAPFDAGPPDAAGPPCPTEGLVRSQSCSCRATRFETCTGGVWRTSSPCMARSGGIYECEPGTVETWTSERCNVVSRTCSVVCQWNDPVEETPRGECDMGSTCGNGCPCTAECRCLVMGGGGCI